MSPRRMIRKMSSSSSASSTGRVKIGDLPDDMLRRVVSLLSARQAVQTSALSRRWRHLWRSAPLLRIVPDEGFPTVGSLKKFVKNLLLLRDHALLDACVINFYCCEFDSYQYSPVEPEIGLWLRNAVSCQAQLIRVEVFVEDDPLCLPDVPLFSKHLRVLELCLVEIKDSLVDFSGCPALEDLKIRGVFINARMISSPSVKHLIISGCGFNWEFRTRISVPNLVSLQLEDFWGVTPSLEDMPLLVTASVSLSHECRDRCVNTEFGKCGDPECDDCDVNEVIDGNGCVLLQGLSGSTTLELKAESRVFMFRWDLKWCPKFSKLKTLLVNEWFMTSNMSGLACLLEHAPLVDRLTVELSKETQNFVEIEDSDRPLKQEFPFKSLKIVEIKCQEGDERLKTILKILSQNGAPMEKITVLQTKRKPRRFGFIPMQKWGLQMIDHSERAGESLQP
uniref:F-box domain-containing protein n=1 Tax=Leersia perrieri TaxID=77586 RepID=A0A0D9XQ46_9ORYZ